MIELQASNVTNGMDLPDTDWGDFSCRRAVDSSSFEEWYLIPETSSTRIMQNSYIPLNTEKLVKKLFLKSHKFYGAMDPFT